MAPAPVREAPGEHPAAGRDRSLRGAFAASAGPLLIVGSVLVVLNAIAFRGRLTLAHPDMPGFWLPTYCFLGRSLAAGHVPAWNPHTMAGLPFAADPQSGWMYLPAMALFALRPCGEAMRLHTLLLPILAGLGTFWFLRIERVARVPATVGGLALALALAGSRMTAIPPFAATLAWTPVVLATGARYLDQRRWRPRLLWGLAAALAWGQLAAAYSSHGVALGTLVLAAYLAARGVRARRDGRPLWEVLTPMLVLGAAFVLVNLAFLLPRLAYLPQTTLGAGYSRLQAIANRVADAPPRGLFGGVGHTLTWPLLLASSPGLYLGAAPLLLSLASWWNRARRSLVAAFSAVAVLCYLFALGPVADTLEPVVGGTRLGDFYLHSPIRLLYVLPVLLALLAALGLEAWTTAGSRRRRAAMLVPGLAVWGLLPPLFGSRRPDVGLLLIGGAVAVAVLALTTRARRVLALVPVLLAVELAANGLMGQAFPVRTPGAKLPEHPLPAPRIDAAGYTRPGAIARFLEHRGGGGRYLSLNPVRGYSAYTRPSDWPFLAGQRSMLFGLEDAQGYNPMQPLPYWTFWAKLHRNPIFYGISVWRDPPPLVLDLLDVRWLVARATRRVEAGASPVLREGGWILYRRPDPPSRASVLGRWLLAGDGEEALRLVASPRFSPSREVVLEVDEPGGARGGWAGFWTRSSDAKPMGGGARPEAAGRARYRWLGPQKARIDVEASGPALVLVRNAYSPNWRAFVDGRPTPLLRANAILMAVPVPEGRHRVLLTFDDPSVGWGLLGSGLAVLALLAAAWLAGRERAPSPPSRAGARAGE